MKTVEDCIFCEIGLDKSPAEIEYEDSEIIAFWDTNPQAPIHILISPKEHLRSIEDMDVAHADLLGKMIVVAKQLAEKKQIDENGYRIVINNGPHSGQIIEHFHIHLLGGKELGSLA